MNGIRKKTLKRFIHSFIGYSKDEEVANINKAMVEMANSFNLVVGEDDIDELLDVVSEELTNELLKMKQEHMAKEEGRENETTGEEKE